jgi:hypothetical protein
MKRNEVQAVRRLTIRSNVAQINCDVNQVKQPERAEQAAGR